MPLEPEAANASLYDGVPARWHETEQATPARVGEPGPGSSSCLCTWAYVKPRLALPPCGVSVRRWR